MSEPTGKIDMTGEEALEVIQKLGLKTREIVKAEIDMERQHASYKSAKAIVEELKEDRDHLYSQLTETMADRPLFSDPSGASGSPNDSPKVAAVATEWRQEPISVLLSHGATQKDIDKLVEAEVKDLGALADCPDLTAIKGIGPAAADRIADAAANYHTSNAAGPDDEDDEPESIAALDLLEGEPADDSPRPFVVSFTRAKPKRRVVYARNADEALAYAMDQLTFVDQVQPIADQDVLDDDVTAHAPEGYGEDDQADADDDDTIEVESMEPEDESQEAPEDED